MTDKQHDTDEMGPEGAADADTEAHVRRYAPSPALPGEPGPDEMTRGKPVADTDDDTEGQKLRGW